MPAAARPDLNLEIIGNIFCIWVFDKKRERERERERGKQTRFVLKWPLVPLQVLQDKFKKEFRNGLNVMSSRTMTH